MIAYDKRRGCYVTAKQLAMLKSLARRNPDGTPKDIYQLIDECAPGPRGDP
jgi:hypothetical protein